MLACGRLVLMGRACPGFWFSPEFEFIMAGVYQSQKGVDGSVELKLTRGNAYVAGRGRPCGTAPHPGSFSPAP